MPGGTTSIGMAHTTILGSIECSRSAAKRQTTVKYPGPDACGSYCQEINIAPKGTPWHGPLSHHWMGALLANATLDTILLRTFEDKNFGGIWNFWSRHKHSNAHTMKKKIVQKRGRQPHKLPDIVPSIFHRHIAAYACLLICHSLIGVVTCMFDV
jgi:hypothetical protein